MVRISNIELLRLLRKNARIPYVRLAEVFGVSEAAVRKRIRKLEQEGVIRGYRAEIDPRKIGYEINVLIGLDAAPDKYISVIERLKRLDEVISLYSASGDHMLLIECWFKTSDELAEFVKMLESMDGVSRVCPAIILEKLK